MATDGAQYRITQLPSGECHLYRGDQLVDIEHDPERSLQELIFRWAEYVILYEDDVMVESWAATPTGDASHAFIGVTDLPGKTVSCTTCGTLLDSMAPRPECPQCGGESITIEVSSSDSASFHESMSIRMIPAEQRGAWRIRWKAVESSLDQILKPHDDSASSDAINHAHHDLQSFFVQAYHLKDILKMDTEVRISDRDIEDAITNTRPLALLADLANLDKHGQISGGGRNRGPRSGSIPVVDPAAGTWSDQSHGWTLSVPIQHKGIVLDGLTVARDAVDAWRHHLLAWRLL